MDICLFTSRDMGYLVAPYTSLHGHLKCSFKSYLTVKQETYFKARYLNIDFRESSCKKEKERACDFILINLMYPFCKKYSCSTEH